MSDYIDFEVDETIVNGGGASGLVVNISPMSEGSESMIMDKTFGEIKNAMLAGRYVVGVASINDAIVADPIVGLEASNNLRELIWFGESFHVENDDDYPNTNRK